MFRCLGIFRCSGILRCLGIFRSLGIFSMFRDFSMLRDFSMSRDFRYMARALTWREPRLARPARPGRNLPPLTEFATRNGPKPARQTLRNTCAGGQDDVSSISIRIILTIIVIIIISISFGIIIIIIISIFIIYATLDRVSDSKKDSIFPHGH